MNELKSTYALLFGEREKETGEVEAVRKRWAAATTSTSPKCCITRSRRLWK